MFKNFYIKVLNKGPEVINGIKSYLGQIKIGDFKEKFIIPIKDWSLKDYQIQWEEGLKRIKTHKRSCLIILVQNINTKAPMVNFWVLYREADIIFIQNHLRFGKSFKLKCAKIPFTIEECYQFLRPRSKQKDEDDEISEWSIKLEDIDGALEGLRKK